MMLSKELIGGQPHANCRKSANIQQQKLNYDEILEAVMRKRDITNDLIFSYTAVLINLRALDISFNKLTSLPIDMPKKLVALNLSFNSISHLQIKSQPTFQLIELQLTHNGLERYILSHDSCCIYFFLIFMVNFLNSIQNIRFRISAYIGIRGYIA